MPPTAAKDVDVARGLDAPPLPPPSSVPTGSPPLGASPFSGILTEGEGAKVVAVVRLGLGLWGWGRVAATEVTPRTEGSIAEEGRCVGVGVVGVVVVVAGEVWPFWTL